MHLQQNTWLEIIYGSFVFDAVSEINFPYVVVINETKINEFKSLFMPLFCDKFLIRFLVNFKYCSICLFHIHIDMHKRFFFLGNLFKKKNQLINWNQHLLKFLSIFLGWAIFFVHRRNTFRFYLFNIHFVIMQTFNN